VAGGGPSSDDIETSVSVLALEIPAAEIRVPPTQDEWDKGVDGAGSAIPWQMRYSHDRVADLGWR